MRHLFNYGAVVACRSGYSILKGYSYMIIWWCKAATTMAINSETRPSGYRFQVTCSHLRNRSSTTFSDTARELEDATHDAGDGHMAEMSSFTMSAMDCPGFRRGGQRATLASDWVPLHGLPPASNFMAWRMGS